MRPVERCGGGDGDIAVSLDHLLDINCGARVAGQHIGFEDFVAKSCEVEV